MNASHLAHEVVEGKTYWFAKNAAFSKKAIIPALLLPNYDEYINRLFRPQQVI
jgi:hypothetical protein